MKWIEPKIVTVSSEIDSLENASVLLKEQLSLRGICTQVEANGYLDPLAYQHSSPQDFDGMDTVVSRIQKAIHKNEIIGIWGDFDVDGQTSTALLVDGLRKAGARVTFHIPDRAQESHGIRLEYLKKFREMHSIDLLITCDTGISEMESLTFAASDGLDVIISDHHSLPQELPPALAIINPWLLAEGHSMRHLAGVGTAFQILRALFDRPGMEALCNNYHDLVALGTIADVAELQAENRFYAQMGLAQMRTALRPALAAMLLMADYRDAEINEISIGFTLAPRLNAAGRLGNASQNVCFLLSKNQAFIQQTAQKLEELNSQRKQAVDGVLQSARELLARQPELRQMAAIVLAKEGWEKGVVGIVASHLVEEFNKPAILLNIDGGQAAGSVRSIPGVNIIEAIRENSALLEHFGGHPMAAGLAIRLENLAAFRAGLSRSVERMRVGIPAEKELQVDGFVPFAHLTHALASEIQSLAPFGAGNPPPVLVSRDLEITRTVPLGRDQLHRRIRLQNAEGQSFESVWWRAGEQAQPEGRIDLAYCLRTNGQKKEGNFTLEWIDWRAHETEEIQVSSPAYPFELHDHRWDWDAKRKVQTLAHSEDLLFWAEGKKHLFKLPTRNRLQLERCRSLAFLGAPPNPQVLHQILQNCHPQKIYLFGFDLSQDKLESLLKDIAGMIQYALNHYEGLLDWEKMAAALGQTAELVEQCIAWWQANGDINIESVQENEIKVARSGVAQVTNQSRLAKLTNSIEAGLTETRAYRSYYMRAEAARLLQQH